MDYLSLKASVAEARPRLTGKRLVGSAQTAKGEILLVFSGKKHMLLSIRADRPGLYQPPEDLPAGGMEGPFPRLLSTRIKGAALASMSMPELGERVVKMVFSSRWPEKEGETLTLVLEVMGRHSNLILLNPDERITGSLKKVPPTVSRVRPVIPGRRWAPPPAREGIAIENLSSEALVGRNLPDVGELMGLVRGLSPVTARLALSRTGEGGRKGLPDILRDMSEKSTGEQGCLAMQEGRWNLFPFPLAEDEAESVRLFTSFAEAAWEWKMTGGSDVRQPGTKSDAGLTARLKNEKKKVQRNLSILEEEENRCRGYGESRLKAESILINLSQIPRGASRVTLPYPSDENFSMDVKLDPSISARANAQRLFAEAKRLKRGLEALKRKRTVTEGALRDIDGALEALMDGNAEPAEKLLKGLRPPDPGGRPGRRKTSGGRSGKSPGRRYWKDGFTILVGKSASDNERVTFEAASPRDLWLHTRDYPSSHVVILTGGKTPPEEVILEAGRLAAAKSGAKRDSAVEIMVTERKWVRKIKGAKPGRVTVERFRSIRVKPKA